MNANEILWSVLAIINAWTLGMLTSNMLRPGSVKRIDVVWACVTTVLLTASIFQVVNS